MPPLAALLGAAGRRGRRRGRRRLVLRAPADRALVARGRARGEPLVRDRRGLDARRRSARVRHGPGAGARRAARRAPRAPARGRRARRADDAHEPGDVGVPGARLRGVVDRRPRARAARGRRGRRRARPADRRSRSRRAGASRSARPRSPGRSASRSRCSWRCPRDERVLRDRGRALRARRCSRRASCSTPRSAATSCAWRPCSAVRSRPARCGTAAARCCSSLALPLLYWQWLAPVRSVVRAAGDPSVAARPTTRR